MAAGEDQMMRLRIDGKDYAIDPDESTLGEVEFLEHRSAWPANFCCSRPSASVALAPSLTVIP